MNNPGIPGHIQQFYVHLGLTKATKRVYDHLGRETRKAAMAKLTQHTPQMNPISYFQQQQQSSSSQQQPQRQNVGTAPADQQDDSDWENDDEAVEMDEDVTMIAQSQPLSASLDWLNILLSSPQLPPAMGTSPPAVPPQQVTDTQSPIFQGLVSTGVSSAPVPPALPRTPPPRRNSQVSLPASWTQTPPTQSQTTMQRPSQRQRAHPRTAATLLPQDDEDDEENRPPSPRRPLNVYLIEAAKEVRQAARMCQMVAAAHSFSLKSYNILQK
ncbi:unnamed protein product [Didymodactylos carnosus]|uniref:Uncharacterized protein n=1 Tax=Didymodactylos carnosus TaxID=1234261 RepID=A0A8S2QZJ3_9BILA|nr:unnamed protein product [Didymodactylos carnosus]CAF4129491.1 unnamed protein product [Didymodactylos carnosus]